MMGLRTQKTCKDSPKTQRIVNMGPPTTTPNNQEEDRTMAIFRIKEDIQITRRKNTETGK